MKIAIIRIGNSKGILLSKTVIDQYGFEDQVEMIMKKEHLELKAVAPPRLGWDEAFKQMHDLGDDILEDHELLDDDILEEWL